MRRFGRGSLLSKHLIAEHQFQLPSGFSRFTYAPDLYGLFRVQTMRMESLEVTQAIMSPTRADRRAAAAAARRAAAVRYEVSQVEVRPPTTTTTTTAAQDNAEQPTAGVLSITVTAKEQPTTTEVLPKTMAAAAPNALPMTALPRLRFSEDDESDDSDEQRADNGPAATNRRKCLKRKAQTPKTSTTTTATAAVQRRSLAITAAITQAVSQLDTNGDDDQQVVKNIRDFSVMKRYLRKENTTDAKIVIELTKVDAAGKVICSESVRANEFRV